jgi:hypothetical protein
MAPASFFTEAPPAALDRTENEKAPSVTGGAQKIPVRDIQRTRNLFESPAQGGLKNERCAHHGRAIEVAHDDPPKMPHVRNAGYGSERLPCSRVVHFRQFNCISCVASRRRALLAKRAKRRHSNISRLNGSCLWAISQLPRRRSSARGPLWLRSPGDPAQHPERQN